jgi:hypothetical protein
MHVTKNQHSSSNSQCTYCYRLVSSSSPSSYSSHCPRSDDDTVDDDAVDCASECGNNTVCRLTRHCRMAFHTLSASTTDGMIAEGAVVDDEDGAVVVDDDDDDGAVVVDGDDDGAVVVDGDDGAATATMVASPQLRR